MKIKSGQSAAAAVIGALALCVAVTGTATATTLITGADIADGTVTGKDLAAASVTKAKVDPKAGALAAPVFQWQPTVTVAPTVDDATNGQPQTVATATFTTTEPQWAIPWQTHTMTATPDLGCGNTNGDASPLSVQFSYAITTPDVSDYAFASENGNLQPNPGTPGYTLQDNPTGALTPTAFYLRPGTHRLDLKVARYACGGPGTGTLTFSGQVRLMPQM
jgi:hypothetical protein